MWSDKLKFRKVILFIADALAICAAYVLAVFFIYVLLRLNYDVREILKIGVIYVICNILGLFLFRVYSSIWRFAGFRDFVNCVLGIVVGSGVATVVSLLWGLKPLFSFMLMCGFITLCAVVFMRLVYKSIYDFVQHQASMQSRENTLIVGGGVVCKAILDEISLAKDSGYNPVCIVDDDMQKQGRRINNVPVVGNTEQIPEICKQYKIKNIIFAIPSCDDENRRRILNNCAKAEDCKVRTIPTLNKIITDEKILTQIVNIDIKDLLGRETVSLEDKPVKEYIENKICMVTGGGGSIGSELCRQVLKYSPKMLIIVDIYENNAYDIQQEIVREYNGVAKVDVQIASVRDFKKMDMLFEKYHPDVVFHAAAHKHVPLMETNPEEAVKNNIFGTLNVAKLCHKHRVKKMVLISTDKAVNPTNVMGATKRCCEMIMQYMAQETSGTEYVAVRFGNVLGSNGSVIPLFKKQIEAGGPVTVTHPDIVRYFMTIPEAVSLVLQAGAIAKGGEIFVLDMGEQVKIVTLAENLIRLYGYEPYSQMPIVFTGLRPGEKLYEELLMDEENLQSTVHKSIYIGNQISVDPVVFPKELAVLRELAGENETEKIVELLHKIVPTFIDADELNAAKQKANTVIMEAEGKNDKEPVIV